MSNFKEESIFSVQKNRVVETTMERQPSDLQATKRRKVGVTADESDDFDDISPLMRTRSASLLGIKESDVVPASVLLGATPKCADPDASIQGFLPEASSSCDFEDDSTPSRSSFTPRTTAHSQLSQALKDFEAAYPGCRSDRFGDVIFQNDVKGLGHKLIECITHDSDWLSYLSASPAELHGDVSGTRYACKLSLSTLGSLSVSLFVLPQVFISQITRKDNADTVYFSLRGVISVKSQIVQNRVYSAVLSNVSNRLTEQRFIDCILELTGVQVKSVDFRPSVSADTVTAIVTFDSSGDFQRVTEHLQDKGPLDWNANMALHMTSQTAVYKQLVQYGEVEFDGATSEKSPVHAGFPSTPLAEAPVTCTMFSQCMSADRLVLQPGSSCFVPASSCRSLCSETRSLLLCIEFLKGSTPQDRIVGQENPRLKSNSISTQAFNFWSAISSWHPHQFRTRAGDHVTARRHNSPIPRPVVRLLDINHSALKPFLEQARGQLLDSSLSNAICNAANMRIFAEVLEHRMTLLNLALDSRPGHELIPDDSPSIFDIGYALARKISEGWLLDDRRRVEVIMNGDEIVLWRYILYDTSRVQIRLHLWNDASETYIHNHRTNFLALGFTGEYTHKTFVIVENEKGSYKAHTRDGTGVMVEPQTRAGCIKLSSEFQHGSGHVYFLNNRAYHAVNLPKSAGPKKALSEPERSPMLTLFVKDKMNNAGTIALEVTDPIPGVDKVPPAPISGQEIELHGDMKRRVMMSMEVHLTNFLKQMGEAPSVSAFKFASFNRDWDSRRENPQAH